MQITGQIKTPCPPEALLRTLHDAQSWASLLPAGSRLEQVAPGQFSFHATRAIGPIRLTLPGTLQIASKGAGHDQTLTIHAAHIIGGKVDLVLDMSITRPAQMTVLAYQGELTATGMAGRVMKEHQARVNDVFRRYMVQLRVQAETTWNGQGEMA